MVGDEDAFSIERETNVEESWDLKRRVRNFLWQRGTAALRSIDVEADNGTVVLRGKVPSYYARQLCLNCCQHVAGVVRVVDEVKVEWPTDQPGHTTIRGKR